MRIPQGILHFYDVDHLLGPLSISIGRMLKDLGWFWKNLLHNNFLLKRQFWGVIFKPLKASFIFILVVFLIPYGIVTTALLYPNELVRFHNACSIPFPNFIFQRFSECLEGIFFKPMLTLYGEMFLSEYTLYDLNDALDCASTENVIEVQTTNPDYSGTDNYPTIFKAPWSTPTGSQLFWNHKFDLVKVSVLWKKASYSRILLIIGKFIRS